MSSLTPSTVRLIRKVKPDFGQGGTVCKYERMPWNDERKLEAGLRAENKFKLNSKSKPLVTYITIVRNNQNGILRCMQSVWNQTYDNVEYIIVDGDSTDGTKEIIMQHLDKIDYVISEPDLGIYHAFNKGLALASGDIINILNSDDALYECAAEQAVAKILSNNADVLFGSAMLYDINGRELYKRTPLEIHEGTLFIGTPVVHNAVYATKKVYEATGPYREDLKIAADLNWMIDMWEHDMIIAYDNDLYVKYSLGGASDDISKFFDDVSLIVNQRYPVLSSAEGRLLIQTFCMYLPPAIIPIQDRGKILSIIDRNKDNQKLILGILKAMMSKNYQYDELINGSTSAKTREAYSLKDRIFWRTRGTIIHRPLKKIYRLIKRRQ